MLGKVSGEFARKHGDFELIRVTDLQSFVNFGFEFKNWLSYPTAKDQSLNLNRKINLQSFLSISRKISSSSQSIKTNAESSNA